jgi:hypothetical protein
MGRKLKPPAKDLHANGASIHHYHSDGRLKLHARKKHWETKRFMRNHRNAPPIQFCVANGNEKYRQYMASAKIQNLYRNYRAKRKLKKIYNAQIATKIMNRKTPQPHLGREVANFL